METYRKYLLTDEEVDSILLALDDLETIIYNLPGAETMSTLDADEVNELSNLLHKERRQAKAV